MYLMREANSSLMREAIRRTQPDERGKFVALSRTPQWHSPNHEVGEPVGIVEAREARGRDGWYADGGG